MIWQQVAKIHLLARVATSRTVISETLAGHSNFISQLELYMLSKKNMIVIPLKVTM
jgi:hypothetical protein